MNLSLRFSNARHMKHVIARAIACGIMLLVLPSCGIPHLRQAEPGQACRQSFNGATSPENSSQLRIEEFYNDPMLTCLIDQAVANNRELKVLNEDVQIAGNEVLARSGAYLPFVSVGAGAGLDRASRFTLEGAGILDDPYLPGKYFSLAHGNFGSGINLTWQLDIYRQLRNARDAAGQRYNVAIERRNYFVTRLVADVAENYYRLMALDKRLENLNHTIELQERSLEIAKARKEAARGTELGVLRFQAEVRRNQSEKLIVNQDIVVTENRINFLVNRYPQPVERMSAGFFDLNINPLSVGVPSQLLQNRPDIRQAERELAATGLDVKVARVNFFPQLVLNGGVGPPVLHHQSSLRTASGDRQSRRRPGRAVRQQEGDQGPVPHRERQAIAGHLQLPARHPQRLHRGRSTACPWWRSTARASRSRSSSWRRSRPRSRSPTISFRMPAPNTSTCSSPSVTSGTRGRS